MSTVTVVAGPRFSRSAARAVSGARAASGARAVSGVGPVSGAEARRGCAARTGGVRLTRRGRLLLTLAVGALVTAVAVLAFGSPSAGAGAAGTGQPASVASYEQVTVAPGQTLWALANEISPSEDPREVVARIMDLNAMSSSTLRAGQVVLLPR